MAGFGSNPSVALGLILLDADVDSFSFIFIFSSSLRVSLSNKLNVRSFQLCFIILCSPGAECARCDPAGFSSPWAEDPQSADEVLGSGCLWEAALRSAEQDTWHTYSHIAEMYRT